LEEAAAAAEDFDLAEHSVSVKEKEEEKEQSFDEMVRELNIDDHSKRAIENKLNQFNQKMEDMLKEREEQLKKKAEEFKASKDPKKKKK
jgi:hypothetical protein